MTHAGSDFSWFFQRAPPGQRALETGKYRQIWQKKAAGESLPRRPNRHTHSHTRRIRLTTMLLHPYMKERLLAAFMGIRPSSFTNVQSILKIFPLFQIVLSGVMIGSCSRYPDISARCELSPMP